MTTNKTEEFIQGLEKTGLTHEEALIYFTLIQHGKKGTYIKDLTDHILIKRTTIYSIINRLHYRGFVRENSEYEGPKGAKMYAAISPELYINRMINLKKNEIEILEKIKIDVMDKLETVYLESVEFSINEIDDFLKPYLKPLYEKGWKVIEHLVEKSQITYGFEAYDTTLLAPDAKIVKDAGFMVFKYKRDVEDDLNTLNYMFDMLSRKGKEEVLNKGIGVVDVELKETKIEIRGKKFRGHLPNFKFEHADDYSQLTETVMIPVKNKIFFMWAENHKLILEMTNAIFEIEKNKQ
jgi:DNA-binding MarR family transcriptional regulator